MSFIGNTEERLIKTTKGMTYKIFITEQVGGFWASSVFYARNGVLDAKHFSDKDRDEAYRQAVEWTINNIDDKAVIDSL
ncbi:hypothetical protein MLD55_05030 [Alcanivorax sp. MM125-6]|nr:hypothetical protein [Alcanivorax sp. MM125-6]